MQAAAVYEKQPGGGRGTQAADCHPSRWRSQKLLVTAQPCRCSRWHFQLLRSSSHPPPRQAHPPLHQTHKSCRLSALISSSLTSPSSRGRRPPPPL